MARPFQRFLLGFRPQPLTVGVFVRGRILLNDDNHPFLRERMTQFGRRDQPFQRRGAIAGNTIIVSTATVTTVTTTTTTTADVPIQQQVAQHVGRPGVTKMRRATKKATRQGGIFRHAFARVKGHAEFVTGPNVTMIIDGTTPPHDRLFRLGFHARNRALIEENAVIAHAVGVTAFGQVLDEVKALLLVLGRRRCGEPVAGNAKLQILAGLGHVAIVGTALAKVKVHLERMNVLGRGYIGRPGHGFGWVIVVVNDPPVNVVR
mmetsp:Transcript_11727/g.32474  ORF Transcript_11727/g.32474 Transcript_11727/m.32474 type:complete len:262 (-) Transcript_11727:633-1418(-)